MRLVALFFLINLLLIAPAFSSAEKLKNTEQLIEIIQGLDDKNLSEKEKCNVIWNTLWPEAKKGNFYAHKYLFSFLASYPHMDTIRMPGTENIFYDIPVMALHILNTYSGQHLGSPEQTERSINYLVSFLSDEWLKTAFPNEDPKNFREEELLTCLSVQGIMNNSVKKCTNNAFENGPFPSFKEYTKVIDERIAAGMKPTCFFDSYHKHYKD